MITKIEGKCQFEGCEQPAEYIACGRKSWTDPEKGHPTPNVYCRVHADVIEEEGHPEYTNKCPNCGCRHGVN